MFAGLRMESGQAHGGVVQDVAQPSFRKILTASDFLKVSIDKSAMYISPLPITNDSEDREGERVDPNGLVIESYRKNPVVYWMHSHQLDPLVPPIACAHTPDRKFDVFRNENTWYSGCLFSQTDKLASQIFHLICEGIVRTRSLGALALDIEPVTPSLPTVALHEGRVVVANPVGSYYRVAEMVEWSWTGIPCNRDMTIEVKSLLSRGRVDGQRLDPFLAKTLRALNLREPVQVPGVSFGKISKQSHGGIGMQVVGLLFDKDVTPGLAKSFLRECPDFVETPIVVDQATGLLKSVQVPYSGEVVVKTFAETPKIKYLVPKTSAAGVRPGDVLKANGTELVRQAVEQAAAGDEAQKKPGKAPQDAGQQAAGGKPAGQAPSEEEAAIDQAKSILSQAVAVEEEDQPLTGPAGSQHLQALVRALAKVLDDSDASIGDVEQPKVRETHTKFSEIARGMLKELSALHDDVYQDNAAVTVRMCSDCKDEAKQAIEEVPDEKAKEAMATKAMIRREAFRGHRSRVPATVAKTLLAAASVKKFTASQGAASAADSQAEAERAELIRRLRFDELRAKVGEISR